MKVKELQEKLNKFDPNLDIVCYIEDEKFATKNKPFTILDIEDISKERGERLILGDQTPYFKFGNTNDSADFLVIELTSNF